MNDFQKTMDGAASVCTQWWHDRDGIDGDNPGSAGKRDRARLRRFVSAANESLDASLDLADMYSIPAFWQLRNKLEKACVQNFGKTTADADERIAVAASVLAHVRNDISGEQHFSTILGSRHDGGETPRFSELRFKRLIRTADLRDLLSQLVRAVRILNENVPVGDLGSSILFWNAPTRRRWAFEYWGQQNAAPDPVDKRKSGTESETAA